MSLRYSAFRPDTGLYDVFVSSERRGLADDMPVPGLAVLPDYGIGVPSTSLGRLATTPLRLERQSLTPQGSILPLSRAGLLGVQDGDSLVAPHWYWLLAGMAGGYLLAVVLGRSR